MTEYNYEGLALDVDIQVRPIVLTHKQCIEYGLPRTPIKADRAARRQIRRTVR
jgi:hypothetical protein